jgi:hypothetical protein
MQYELDNLKTLCVGCHIYWWHKNPIEATEWFKATFPERYKKLKAMSQNTNLPPLNYEAIKKTLEKAIKKYEKNSSQ